MLHGLPREGRRLASGDRTRKSPQYIYVLRLASALNVPQHMYIPVRLAYTSGLWSTVLVYKGRPAINPAGVYVYEQAV